MACETNGWQHLNSSGHHLPPMEPNLESDDDTPLSTLVQKLSLKCDKCASLFSDLSTLKKHLRKYKHEHGYCGHCNSVKNEKHRCRGNSRINSKTDEKTKKRRKGRTKGEGGVEKPIKCGDCSSSFWKDSGLKVHVRIVHKAAIRKCPTCEETFETVEEYSSHVALHGPEDKIICKNCRAEFNTMKQYRSHAKLFPAPHNFRCNSCLRQFPTESRLEDHLCICTNGQPLLCVCGESFTTYSSVVEHARGSKPFRCCSCDYASQTLRAYIHHVRKHSKHKPFHCSKCNGNFYSLEQLTDHMKNIHEGSFSLEEMKYGCVRCGMLFNSSTELQQHDAFHQERMPCPDCGKTVRSSRMEIHRMRHSPSSCLCPDCGKLFESPTRFTQHMQSAHTSKPVTCDVCQKSLKTKKILTEHLKTHLKTEVGTRVAQAICPMCGLELAQKGSLGRHILLMHERHRIVDKDHPVACKECGVVLPTKSKYYTHRRQHRALVERFPCPICKREFNKKQNLVRHMHLLHDSKRKLEEPSHNCEMCPRTFRERKNLTRHYRSVHKVLFAKMT